MKTVLLIGIMLQMKSINLSAQPVLKDIFGRNLSGQTIALVDWEGYIANPAIKLTIQPPSFPLTVTVHANGARLYFDMPSSAGASGPTKTISFTNSNPKDFYISIFPDRADGDENYSLTLSSTYGTQTYSVHVIDQDSATPTINYNILIDYSQDKPAYNFFSNQTHKNIVRQAADDWAFFLNNMNFDNVNANTQQTFIWNDDFAGGNWVTYPNSYNGFLLYAYGFDNSAHRSGGEPSSTSFQTIGNAATNLRRSGGYEADAHGNYNTLGWDTTINDNTWYTATNFGNVQNDLYSIAIHEMGHAFCFNPGYPIFQTYKNQGYINDALVVAYQGSNVPVDAFDHLSNGQSVDSLKFVDRLSKKGAFGSEYAAVMPYGRWLISKVNLLVLKAIGYNIKNTSAFKAVNISTLFLPNSSSGQSYSSNISADGGIPFYKFALLSGTLPTGLTINSFTGNISGTPTQTGTFTFTIRVTDYDNKIFDRAFSINITTPKILNLKLFIEGYYIGANAMTPALMNEGVNTNGSITDSIEVQLRNAGNPYGIVASTKVILNTNGTAVCTFPVNTASYYIAVKHRNGVQTWSALPVSLSASTTTYDFTTASSKAFGNNMAQVGLNLWAFFAGDLNEDENIDLFDIPIMETDINNFQFGYFATDLNGDGNVDLLDLPLLETNVNNFVFSIHP